MSRINNLRKFAIRPLLRGAALLAGLATLSGCATFNEVPTVNEIFAEQVRCSKSLLCRTFIEDRPPQLVMAINDAPIGAVHAEVAECILKKEGIETRKVVVQIVDPSDGQLKSHTFLSARLNDTWYALDNGVLPFCGRVCKLSEALHNVQPIDYAVNGTLAAQ